VVDSGGGILTYTPDADFNGSDSFTYTINDGRGGTDSATVSVAITPFNDAPNAVDDSAVTEENQAVVIAVRDNDSDVDGDVLTVSSVTHGSNGAVTTDGSTVTYTPNTDLFSTDSFTYTVSDGNGGFDTA
jgi:hypothetical protein